MTESQNTTNPCNLISFPYPPAKTVPVNAASPFSYWMPAHTDVIGGTVHDMIYREERVKVDPDAELEHDCLIILQLRGGMPHMQRWQRTYRDQNGRFVSDGDARENFLFCGLFRYSSDDIPCDLFRILGRVVGEPRRF